MVVVVVQVGQAGNQVGAALWQLLAREDRPSSARPRIPRELSGLLRPGQDGRPRARAVLIDTEPKAVRAAMRGPAGGLLDPERCVLGHSGCANNWAYGYLVQQSARERKHLAGGPLAEEKTILDAAMEAIRAEVECCTGMVEFLLIHSIAGGSGSGLGSRVLEGLRERYPLAYIVTAAVVPSLGGDTPTQSLNACLTIQWLQAYADGVFLFRNDALLAGLASSGATGAPQPVSLERINRQIARCLAGILLPADPPADQAERTCHLPLKQLVLHACPDPEMKFLEVYHAAAPPSIGAGRSGWESVARQISALAGRFDTLNGNWAALSSGVLAVARGGGLSSGVNDIRRALQRASALACVDWRDDPMKVLRAAKPCPGFLAGRREPASKPASSGRTASSGADVAVTIACNRSTVVGLLRHLSNRALQLCKAGAYMHWYERHGCCREAIEDAAWRVREVADTYAYWYRMHEEPPPEHQPQQDPR